MPIAPGTRLGPYVVQESIGQGAMGVVYRAYHAQLERTGAVKVLQALSPDADTTARFRREAQAIAQMRHPNVLNVYDFGEYEGTPYMIVEYVEGGSLAGRLKRDMTPAQALHYLRGIGSALDYAHSLGIVHRDVKPANVLIGRNDTAILADFGLAKLLQSASIKSATGVTTGTPAYMAPEQVEGSQVGPPADRYSLAVMAFEMLTSSLPFDEVGVLEVLYAHVHREPPHPSARNTTLTNRVDAIVLRGLAKDPKSRWESCEAFVSALEHAMLPAAPEAERTIAFSAPAVASMPPPPVTPVQPVASTSPTALVTPAPAAPSAAPSPAVTAAAPQQKRSRRGPWIALGAAAVILVLLVVSIGLFIASRAPTIDLRPSTVAAGGHVTVIATHVPKDQSGTIELHSSVERVYTFRADSSGNVSRDIDIPVDAAVGNHEVDICWNGTCRARHTLQVVPRVALITPGTSPSSSSTVSPGASAPPNSSASPSPRPSQASGASPTPTRSPSPTPTKAQSPALTLTSVTVKNPLNNHIPKITFSVANYQGSTGVWVCQAVAGCISIGTYGNGSYSVTTPSRIQVGLSTWVAACSSGSGCVKSNAVLATLVT